MKEIPQEGSCLKIPEVPRREMFEEAPEKNLRAKTEMARRICFNCIVRDECLELVLDEMPPTGVYAGMDPQERIEYKYGGEAA